MSARSSSSTPQSLLQRGEVAPGDEVEIGEERRHRRVEAVALAELEGEALGEVAGADAGRLEGLDRRRASASTSASGAPRRSASAARSARR